MADQVNEESSKTVAKDLAKEERAAAKAKAKAAEKNRVKTLARLAEDKLLNELKSSLDIHARSATFACGGAVPFKHATEVTLGVTKDDADATVASHEINPVQVRFGESGKGITVIFGSTKSSSKELQELIAACQSASFGRGGDEVLDENYRKAGKLDTSAFATTFCPYEAGIIDVVTQLLVPQTSHDKHMRSIKAELYKLNVYSGPCGKFKAHVDTPRNEMQLGSLVVALPVKHEGGTFAVRNMGKGVLFDWSTSSIKDNSRDVTTIKWAAFYSDCEHEVYEVTSGHRITLTYNLHVIRGLGHLAGIASMLDLVQLPFYKTLSQALDNPGFLRRGRVLALWLTHSYAHTNKYINFLPSSLKGADMTLYEIAKSLGLKCVLVPIITQEYGGHYDDAPRHLFQGAFYGLNGGRGRGSAELDEFECWGHEIPNSKVTWLNPDAPATKDKEGKKVQPEQKFKEVQLAYMTLGVELLSESPLLSI